MIIGLGSVPCDLKVATGQLQQFHQADHGMLDRSEVTCVVSEPKKSAIQRCHEVREQLRVVSHEADRLQATISQLLAEIQDGQYWNEWGYGSFGDFVRAECSFGVRKAQELVRVHRKFIDELGLSLDELLHLDWSKAAEIARVIDQENCEELLDAARNDSLRELRQRVRKIQRFCSGTTENAPGFTAIEELAELASGSWGDDETASRPNVLTVGCDLDWLLPRPDETEFYVSEENWEQLCFAAAFSRNLLLIGPSGCGKSEVIYLVARAAGRPLEAFNFGAMSEPRSALIGNTHLDRSKGTWFQKSRFVSAVETTGTCVLLDEISRAGRDAFNIVLPLLDRQGYLALDESEEAGLVHRAEGVCFFATANVGMEYTGATELDQALIDRFGSVIQLDFPPYEQELQLLLRRCRGLSEQDAAVLLQIAHQQREHAREGDFVGFVSTRALIEAGEQIARGIRISKAFKYCVMNRFPDDGGDVGERARLQQLLDRFVDE